MSTLNEDIVDAAVVMKMLKVSRATVYALAKDGSIPCLKVGKQYRFRVTDIEAFIESAFGSKKPEPEDQPTLDNPKKESAPVPPPMPTQEPEKPLLFSSKDMWEATVLLTEGIHLHEVEYNRTQNWFIFHFIDSTELRTVLSDHFHNQLNVTTHEFIESYKNIKAYMNKMNSKY